MKSYEEARDGWIWTEVCHQGLEYTKSGNLWPEFQRCVDFGKSFSDKHHSEFRSCMCSKYLEEIADLKLKMSAMIGTPDFNKMSDEIKELKDKLDFERKLTHGAMAAKEARHSIDSKKLLAQDSIIANLESALTNLNLHCCDSRCDGNNEDDQKLIDSAFTALKEFRSKQ